MLISTRGRYALRVIIELCSHGKGEFVPLNIIAENHESIVALLVKAGFVEGLRGKKGGYRLTKDADEYSVGEILKLTEGTLAPVTCLEENAESCPRSAECKTLPMWEKLDTIISNYLYSVKISDLLKPESVSDWVI